MKLMASAVVILFASLAIAQTGGTAAPTTTEKTATTTTTTTTAKPGATATAPTHDMAKMKNAHAMAKACEGKTGAELKKCQQDEAKKATKTH